MKKTNSIVKIIVIISFLSVTLLGCSISTNYIQTGSRVYKETNPDAVKIYSGTPTETFNVIGSIAVYAVDKPTALDVLQEKAALLGADAVIDARLSTLMTSNKQIGINGTAIKFKK